MSIKKFILSCLFIFCITPLVLAVPTTYSNTKSILVTLDNYWWDGQAEISTTWQHNPIENPFPGGSIAYDQALADGSILNTELTVVVDDLDFGNSASLQFQDKDGTWHGLGYLNTMSYADEFGLYQGLGNPDQTHLTSTTFQLDPHWLDGVSVNAQLNWVEFGGLAQIEIETATLSITADNIHAPAPAAILICSSGVGIIGWLRRRKFLA